VNGSPDALSARLSTSPRFFGGALVAIASLLVFGHTLAYDFVLWDDDINILQNPAIHELTPTNLAWMFSDPSYIQRFSPLSWICWALLYRGFGPNPAAFHLANIILHALNASLVFLLAHRLLTRAEFDKSTATLPALVGALWWCLHPLRAEPVAWITGFRFLLGTAWALLSALLYLSSTSAFADRPRFHWCAIGTFLGSMLTYPVAALLPGAFLVIDIWPLGRLAGRPLHARIFKLTIEKLPFALISLCALLMTATARRRGSALYSAAVSLNEFGLGDRLAQAAYVWLYYFLKPIWPTHLAILYTRLIHFDPQAPFFVACAVGLAAISILIFLLRRRIPGFAAGWTLHLLLLVPALGLTERPHFTNDRYSYLPSIVWALGIAWFAASYVRRLRLFLALSSVAIIIEATAAYNQAQTWRSTPVLLRNAIDAIGDSDYRPELWARLGLYHRARGEESLALQCFNAAIRIQPDHSSLEFMLEILAGKRRFAEAEAVLMESLSKVPSARTRTLLASLLALQHRFPEASHEVDKAIALDARCHEAWYVRGRLLLHARKIPEAVEAMQRAVDLDPHDVSARRELEATRRLAGLPP
jgi:tetratricopeptide (TPR) repeat protein